jgi:hypothetical protein
VANITSYNVNDIALYYQAISRISDSPLNLSVAMETVRKRLVEYLEHRRAELSLPPARGEFNSLGEKVIAELRQMGFVESYDGQVRLTSSGRNIKEELSSGKGRQARWLILARMIETFDNLRSFLSCITPPEGRTLSLPIPRALESDVELDETSLRNVEGVELKGVCAAWTDWCKTNKRLDLIPSSFEIRAGELFEQSRDKSIGGRITNVVQQLVLDQVTGGTIKRVSIYRTLRDRLRTAGALSSWVRYVPEVPLALETVFSCLNVGPPYEDKEWVKLDVRIGSHPVYIHEPPYEALEPKLQSALEQAAASLAPRAGYYRVYEIRDRVCEALRISEGVFNAAFVRLYRTQPGLMTLGVDYETITAKRLPIEIREGNKSDSFNLVAFKNS